MQTMYPAQPNSPAAELATAIDATQTTIEVTDGSKLPDAPNIAVIGTEEDAETIKYETKNGNTLENVTRGLQGTAKAWGAGEVIARNFTAYDYDALRTNIETHTSDTSNPHNVTKSQVGLGNVDNVKQASKAEFDSLSNTVSEHLADEAKQPEGVHGLRVQNGQLEYWDKDEQEWKRIAGGVEVPLGNVKNFHAVPGNGQVTLFWEDPDDVEVEGVVVSKWAGTKILRKVGSWPENENDGVLVVNNGIRNQYSEIGFVDNSGLENDVTYYYLAVPYNTQGLHTVSEANRVSATPRGAKIYGLEWNQTLDTYQRLDDAVGMTAITQGQNDFNDAYPWSEMKRCNLDDDGNVLAYYGDPTFKDDGSNGQVMVQIPKFWYRSEMVNEGGEKKYRWWIADAPVEGFKLHPAFSRNGVEKDVIYIGAYEGYVSGGMLHSRAGVMPTANRTIVQFRNDAQARGSIWHQQDFLTTCAIQLLYLIEYAHFDSQTKIGQGITNDSNFHQTGETAQYGNESYGTTSNATTAMSYRGIENLYGNYFQWVDGININNHVAYIADHNFQSDKFDEHYRQVGFTNSSSNGYVKDIGWTEIDDLMFLAIDATGSSTSYLHDYYSQFSGARVALFGGARDDGSYAGAFYWALGTSSSGSSPYIGARLLCVP